MPAQPYQICNGSGFLLLGTAALTPDTLHDGVGIESASLSQSVDQIQAAGIGDAYKQTDVLSVSYQIQATIFLPKTNTGGLLTVGLGCYATYMTQGTTPTTVFAGFCKVTSVSDTQSYGQYYKQSITLESNGAPDTAPYTPAT